jgi:phage portal protein BeeE
MPHLSRERSYWQSNSIYLDNIYNKIATDVAMMRFKHVKILRDQNGPDTWEWLEQSDIANAVSYSPNERDTPIVFWSAVIRKMLADGVAAVVPAYTNGKITELNLADSVAEYKPDEIAVMIGDEEHTISRDNAWIFENPKRNLTAQLGQITRLIDDNLHTLSDKINVGSNSWLRGLLKIPTKAIDQELRKRAETRVANIMAAARNGGIGYLEQGEEFQELSQTYSTASADEMEFLKSQLYQAFGINEKLFTCDYREEQYRAYYQSVIKVYIRVISEEINRKAFSLTARTQGHRLLVYMDILDVTSLKDLNEFGFKMKYSGIMNANEIREIFGLGSYAGGDTYESNRNAIPISGGGTNETERNFD